MKIRARHRLPFEGDIIDCQPAHVCLSGDEARGQQREKYAMGFNGAAAAGIIPLSQLVTFTAHGF